MNETAPKIKQILTSFETFLTIYENPNWQKTANTEDIKSAFKLALFIEKTMQHFKNINSKNEFLNTMQNWQIQYSRNSLKSQDFYSLACDQLLGKYLKHKHISETTLDIAIRIYTSLFPRERLQNFFSTLLIRSGSFEAISDFAKSNLSDIDQTKLECRLKLNSWSEHLQKSNHKVYDEIVEHFSTYKIESSLYVLIGILILKDISENEKNIQNIILEKLLEKMSDRSVLSKTFWLTLFKQIEIRYIYEVCVNIKDFLISLFNFIVYIGSMMEKEYFIDSYVWQSNSTISLCPEISYYEILHFITYLYKASHNLRQFIACRLVEAKEQTDHLMWDDVITSLEI